MNVLASLLPVLFLVPVAAPTPADDPLLLTHVHVVDVEAGTVLRDHAVLVEDGRVVRVAPADELAAPPGARVVDGGGRHLVPGLHDMHVHFNGVDDEEHLLLYLANGVTTVRSMHGGAHPLALREGVRSGRLLGPHVFTTGPTTAQEGMHTVEEARELVQRQKEAGYDAIKHYGDGKNTLPRESYRELITRAHEAGLKVLGHAPRNLPFSVVLAEGQDSIDHMEEIVYTDEGLARYVGPYVEIQFGRRPLATAPETEQPVPDFAALASEEIEDLARRVAAAGLTVTPTLVTFGTIQDITDGGLFERLARPEMRYAHPMRLRQWAPGRVRFRNGNWTPKLAFMSDYLRRNHELQVALTGAFHRAGVPILPGTDAPFDLVLEGFSLHEELALLRGAGLSALDVLRAATLHSARELDRGEDSGSIAAGKVADLVLVDGDPLEDTGALARVQGVCLAGRWLDRPALQEPLEELAARYARMRPRIEGIAQELEAGDVEAAVALYRALDETDAGLAGFVEREVNGLGYRHLQAGRKEEAHRVLELNTRLFPEAYNTWDSLGEALWNLGRPTEAIAAYERSLELDPTNGNARVMIERILDEDG